ncbi:9020_t:CDS:2, partial [Funneliformis geosporum]
SEIDSTFNDIFTSSNRVPSTAPSTALSASTVFPDEDQFFTDDDSDDNDNSTNELPMLDSTNSNQPILHKAIEWLSATLPLSDNAENRADGRKLKKRLLLPYEWDLLKQIVDLLEPFDDATTYFSKTFYATLSIIYPLIKIIISQNSPS